MIIINQENGKRAHAKTFACGALYGLRIGMTPESYTQLLEELDITGEDFTLTDDKGYRVFLRDEAYGINKVVEYY